MRYKVGDLIQGTIIRILPYGAMMIFEDNTKGLLHISEVSNNYVRNIYHYLHAGTIYLVKVLNIDEEKNFLKVSLKQVSKEERETEHKQVNTRIREFFDSKILLDNLPNWISVELNKINNKENK